MFGPKDGCEEDDSGLSVAVWAGIGAGAALILLLILCVCCWCIRSKKQKEVAAQSSAWQAHEANGAGHQHESLIAASIPSVQQQVHDSYQDRAQPTISPVVQPLPYQEPLNMNEMSKISAVPEAVKGSAAVTSAASSVPQRESNQGLNVHNNSGSRYHQAPTQLDNPPQQAHVVRPDMDASEDEELEGDPGPGPTMYDGTNPAITHSHVLVSFPEHWVIGVTLT